MKKMIPEHPYTEQEIRNYAATHVFVPGITVMVRRMLTPDGEIRSDLHYTMDEPPVISKIPYLALHDPSLRPAVRTQLAKDINSELEYLDRFETQYDYKGLLSDPKNQTEMDTYREELEHILDNPDSFLDSLMEKHFINAVYHDSVEPAHRAYEQAIRDIENLPPMLQMLVIESGVSMNVVPNSRFVTDADGKETEVKVEIIADLFNPFAPVGEKNKKIVSEMIEAVPSVGLDQFSDNGFTVIRHLTAANPSQRAALQAISDALVAGKQRDRMAMAKVKKETFEFKRNSAHSHNMYRAYGHFVTKLTGTENATGGKIFPATISYVEGQRSTLFHELAHFADDLLKAIFGIGYSYTSIFLDSMRRDREIINVENESPTQFNSEYSVPRLHKKLAKFLSGEAYQHENPALDDTLKSGEIVAQLTRYYFEILDEGFQMFKAEAFLKSAFPNTWPHVKAIIIDGLEEILIHAYEHRDKPNALDASLKHFRDRVDQEPDYRRLICEARDASSGIERS